jgi:hypothetical protein
MSCPHGCRDGWIHVGDAVRACKCQRGRNRNEYPAGGLTTKAKRRRAYHDYCVKGGIASGVKRRQTSTAKPRKRYRDRQEALALLFPHKQPTRLEYNARYELFYPPPSYGPALVAWCRCRDLIWLHLVARWRRYRYELAHGRGQHYTTTKPKCRAALPVELDDRTIYNYNKRLERLGYFWFKPERNRIRLADGSIKYRDYLVVEIRTPSSSLSDCRSEQEQSLVPRSAPAPFRSEKPPRAENDPDPPAAPAEIEPADKPPERPVTEREQIERDIAFQQLKLDSGWDSERPLAEIRRLRQALRLLDQATEGYGSAPVPAPGSAGEGSAPSSQGLYAQASLESSATGRRAAPRDSSRRSV